MNTAACGTALWKYSAVLYCTLLYFWYNWFVIYSQNKVVCDNWYEALKQRKHDQ